MTLPPHLVWKRWHLRDQPVPRDGNTLSTAEFFALEVAGFALVDEVGTRRVAVDGEAAQMRAAEVLAGEDRGTT